MPGQWGLSKWAVPGWFNRQPSIKKDEHSELFKMQLDQEVLCENTPIQPYSRGDQPSIISYSAFLYYHGFYDLDSTRREKIVAMARQGQQRSIYVEILNQMLINNLTWPAMLEDIVACGLRREVSICGPAPGNGISNINKDQFQQLITCLFYLDSPVMRLSMVNLVYLSPSIIEQLSNGRKDLTFDRKGIGVFSVSRRDDLSGRVCRAVGGVTVCNSSGKW